MDLLKLAQNITSVQFGNSYFDMYNFFNFGLQFCHFYVLFYGVICYVAVNILSILHSLKYQICFIHLFSLINKKDYMKYNEYKSFLQR